MKKIRATIVEDERLGREALERKLKTYCPQIELVGSHATAIQALQGIPQQKPDLVFLDIGLDTLSGFELLNRLNHLDFEVIFTTTSRDHPVDAIRVGAVDYLSKPFTDEELVDAVNRAEQRISRKFPAEEPVLLIVGSNRDHLIPMHKIMYCIADSNLTEVHVDGEARFVLASETLGKLELRLPSDKFFRIHRSACINRDYLKGINRHEGLRAMMTNNRELIIARDKKNEFYRWMGLHDA